jgi:hypothetical protein
MEMKTYYHLNKYIASKEKSYLLKTIFNIETEESGGSKSYLGSKKEVRRRLVDWWNEKGTQHDISYQRPSFVLMQEMKKKLKGAV